MIYYKNISNEAKTFHGVTFQPGEVAGSNNYIDHRFMIVVPEPVKKKPTKEAAKDVPQSEIESKPMKEVKSDGEDRNK